MLLRENLGGFWSLLDSLSTEKSTFVPCSCVEIVDECFFNLFTVLADVQGKMSELQKEISQLIGGLHFDPYFTIYTYICWQNGILDSKLDYKLKQLRRCYSCSVFN